MERILRSREMVEIILLPVRHHSPACAFHVTRMIEKYQPSVILVEGPENANALVPVMVHQETKAPFAIYYSYYDTEGKISGDREHYRCYYPFLDYSPELAALRTGAKQGILTEFIDLSYGDILLSQTEGRGLRKEEERHNYNDDYLLTENAYLKKLCEKAGLRSFDEFWEKYFEINGFQLEDETWFRNLLVYCTQARENTPPEALKEEGCLAREARMAERILEHARRLNKADEGRDPGTERILVVTGGFHTIGLKNLLDAEAEEREPGREPEETAGKRGMAVIPLKDQGVYLMPYSLEAADALNGYASGMPFPGFYQRIWDTVEQAQENPFEKAVLELLVSSGKETRKKEGYLSTYDEICGLQMALGLAALRGKQEPGAYELLDAVLSSYVKGEYNIATDTPMRILRKQMTGEKLGCLWEGADVPPILHDFREQCRGFGLKTGSTLESEVTLSIFSSKKHREMSKFFYRMDFLHTEFARKKKGPNLTARADRNLMREIWSYKWNVRVDSALIDVSVHGATLEEAVGSLVKAELKKELTAGEGARLLVRVFEMGLSDQLEQIYDREQELIHRDTDFYSLADALKSLMMMQELGRLYHSSLEFGVLLLAVVRKLITLLPTMTRIRDEELADCMNALKLLYQITGRRSDPFSEGSVPDWEQQREDFFEMLLKMQEDGQIQSGVDGCVHGILYGGGRESVEEVARACRGYLCGTGQQVMKTARFFRGLFFSARDLVFTDHCFLEMLDSFLGQVQNREFMELLPELRMAFTYFTPREIDRIAECSAGLHGLGREAITRRREVLPDWYAYGKELDEYARRNSCQCMSAGGKTGG